jgi:hypothetical protein
MDFFACLGPIVQVLEHRHTSSALLPAVNFLTRLSGYAKRKRILTQVGPSQARMLSACSQRLSFVYERKLALIPEQAETFQGENRI